MSAAYKGVGGWIGVVGRVGGLTMLVDTGDQAVCTVGQIDHSSPDHTTSRADIQCDRIGPHATILMPLKGLTGSIMVLRDLTGLTTGQTLLCLDSARVLLLQ